MCYDVQSKLETLLKRAIRFHDDEGIRRLKIELAPYLTNHYHVSGFTHPSLLIYPDKNSFTPIASVWGLVPYWVKDQKQKLQLWNNTINARGETIFEKPSFREAALKKRCVLYVDGFYEHHYHKSKPYPFFISKKDKKPMAIGGLWSEWLDKESGEIVNTFTIVTTKANEIMKKIHNNPKLAEARMPLILNEQDEEKWLESTPDENIIKSLIQPYTETELTYHSVQKLRGKNAVGNIPEASEEFIYEELESF